MRIRLNLQWKVLLLVAGAMTAILLCSFYLHQAITRSLIEEDRYHAAVSHTVALAGRITAHELFNHIDELRQDIRQVTISDSDVRQIDIYRATPEGLHLETSTLPDAPRLPALDENTRDNELGEMEHPVPDTVSEEILVQGHRYWLITTTIKDPDGSGCVSALILKNQKNALVSKLQLRHNLVLGCAIVVSVLLLYLLFVYFFRRPARDIVHAMAQVQAGDLNARSLVRREDELGEIARGFNRMTHDLGERDRERDRLLTQISGFNEELHRQIEAATKQLRVANEMLLHTQQRLARYERLAAIGQVAASLAHETGTPLNAINGHLQLLSEKFPHDAETQRRVGIIQKQVNFIVSVVRKLLQRTHKRVTVMKPILLNDLIRELLLLAKPLLDAHSVAVSLSLASDLPPVLADSDSLQQVFVNLVNNSIDAMPEGGGLEITTRLDPSVRVAELVFRDSGEGIPPDALEHLFEPLWTTKDVGSGFGLAIAKEIMREHGGTIEVVNEQTQGAAFRLTLPMIEAALSAKASSVTEGEVLTDVA